MAIIGVLGFWGFGLLVRVSVRGIVFGFGLGLGFGFGVGVGFRVKDLGFRV